MQLTFGDRLKLTPGEADADAESRPRPADKPTRARDRDRNAAERLGELQREISVSEFFVKNRHLLGFDSASRALLTAVKEAVDNALDACEEAGFLPDLLVQITSTGEMRYRITVEDNGPGIVRAQVPRVFGQLLYGSKFHRLRQSRGQQGIGISAAGMFAQLTTGQPVQVVTKVDRTKPAYRCDITIDTTTNQPLVLRAGIDTSDPWLAKDHGTSVSMELEAAYKSGRHSVDAWLQQVALANPHARLEYHGPATGLRVGAAAAPLIYPRVRNAPPPRAREIKPHPHGVELGVLLRMAQASRERSIARFLESEFSRVSLATAEEICTRAGIDPAISVHAVTQAELTALYSALSATKLMAPPTSCLAPIGEAALLEGLKGLLVHWHLEGAAAAATSGDEGDPANARSASLGAPVASVAALPPVAAATAPSPAAAVTSPSSADATIAAGLAGGATAAAIEARIKAALDEAAIDREDADDGDAGEGGDTEHSDQGTAAGLAPGSGASGAATGDASSATSGGDAATTAADPATPRRRPLELAVTTATSSGLLRVGASRYFVTATTRSPSVYRGNPFQVEAAIAYGGALAGDQPALLYRFANRVPLVYQQGACAITRAVERINWKAYEIEQARGGLPIGPLLIAVHIASVWVPFTSEAKEAVAEYDEIMAELRLALQECGRRLALHIRRRRRVSEHEKRTRTIEKYIPHIGAGLAEILDLSGAEREATVTRLMETLAQARALPEEETP